MIGCLCINNMLFYVFFLALYHWKKKLTLGGWKRRETYHEDIDEVATVRNSITCEFFNALVYLCWISVSLSFFPFS